LAGGASLHCILGQTTRGVGKLQTAVDTHGGSVYFSRTMLMRISLIVAILAALGAGTLNVLQVRDHINTLITQRQGYHDERDQARTELASTKSKLTQTQSELAQTQQQLSDSKAAQKKAEDLAAAQVKRADDLADKLAKATQDRDAAQADLAAYKGTGKSPQEILQLVALIKQDQDAINALTEEGKKLNRMIVRQRDQLDRLLGTANPIITLPAGLSGDVVVVDPKWDFVVLDVGEDQGLRENGELLVSRDGKLVAKVIVRSVDRNRSIANIMPGWKLGEVFEGDKVTPAHPET
jgi:hypothetical protein